MDQKPVRNFPLREVIVTKEYPDFEKLRQLYHSSFPEEERIPFPIIQNNLSDFRVLSGWYLEDQFAAMTYMLLYEDLAYIAYITTAPDLRNQGYGKYLLNELKKKYSSFRLLCDIEDPGESAGNTDFAARRRAFYLRNEFRPCGFRYHFFGVDYEMLSWNGNVTAQEWKNFVSNRWGEEYLQYLFLHED